MHDAQQVVDAAVRTHIYHVLVETGVPPSARETALAVATTEEHVAASYRRLHDGHVLVLERGTLDIRLAFPFSAVPTPFSVRAGQESYFGSCAWDALGIAAVVHRDVVIETTCADCRNPLVITVTDGAVSDDEYVVHFAVAASAWWEDVVYT